MKVRTAPLENREIQVTLEPDADSVEDSLRKEAEDVGRTVNIPGFRKSRVPFRVIERFVGRPALLAQVHEKLSQQLIQEYVEENFPEDVANLTLARIADEPVAYTYHLCLEPYVKLGDLSDLRVETQPLEMSEEERTEVREELLKRHQEIVDVDDAAALQDWVTVDIGSRILDEDLQPTDETVLEEEDFEMLLEEEGTLQPPGLEREMVGLRVGEKKEFDLPYPEDSSSMHAGKVARFNVELKSVQRSESPAWSAEVLAKDLGADEANHSLETCEEVFWNRAQHGKTTRIFQQELDDAIEAMADASIMEIGAASVEGQVDILVNQRMMGLRQFGVQDLESYLRFSGQTLEEFRESLRPEALKSLRRNLLLWEFTQERKIEISQERHARLERQAREEAVRMAERARSENQAVQVDTLAGRLLEYSVSETLNQIGFSAILEHFTDGEHSIERYEQDLPNMTLPETEGASAADADADGLTGAPAAPASEAAAEEAT